MTASIVFLSALGWAGLLGAFFLAASISAPISWRALRPRPSRTWGNHSFSSSSMSGHKAGPSTDVASIDPCSSSIAAARRATSSSLTSSPTSASPWSSSRSTVPSGAPSWYELTRSTTLG